MCKIIFLCNENLCLNNFINDFFNFFFIVGLFNDILCYLNEVIKSCMTFKQNDNASIKSLNLNLYNPKYKLKIDFNKKNLFEKLIQKKNP